MISNMALSQIENKKPFIWKQFSSIVNYLESFLEFCYQLILNFSHDACKYKKHKFFEKRIEAYPPFQF